eukprot:Gb_20236 [translate_table: standard]
MSSEMMKWHGSIQGVVAAPLDQVWDMVSQSSELPKWMPMVEQCKAVQGEEGIPGYIRDVIGDMFPQPNGDKSWIRERLLVMDSDNYSYTYTMESGNVGLEGYINTIQLFDFSEETTLVHWAFEVNPVMGSAEENITEYLGFLYKSSIKRLEMAVTIAKVVQADSLCPQEGVAEGEANIKDSHGSSHQQIEDLTLSMEENCH